MASRKLLSLYAIFCLINMDLPAYLENIAQTAWTERPSSLLNKKAGRPPSQGPDPLYYLSRFCLSPYTSRHFVQILVHIILSSVTI